MSSTGQDKTLFALVDCNNFYASCERVFNPKLKGKPIVVLSNNDGCVIARSNEAKALGIPMGAPAFQYRDSFKKNGIVVISSNYALYGQMSQRIMQTMAVFTPDMEIYSIDEAFLQLIASPDLPSYARRIRETVIQWTGVPISLGIAATKTLAKLANRYAKKNYPKEGVFLLEENKTKEILADFPVQDIWGIGRQLSAFLQQKGINSAWELACAEDAWIKKNLTVVGLRTVWELRGISCLALEEASPNKKSIVCSRSFGRPVHQETELAEALASYVSSAAERLRGQESLASYLEVFVNTNRFQDNGYYSNTIHVHLPVPTDYTPALISYAKYGLKRIFKSGYAYQKVGVMLGGIVSSQAIQLDFFDKSPADISKQQLLMKIMDKANARYGKNSLMLAAQGIEQKWKTTRSQCSHHFTTVWDELLVINI